MLNLYMFSSAPACMNLNSSKEDVHTLVSSSQGHSSIPIACVALGGPPVLACVLKWIHEPVGVHEIRENKFLFVKKKVHLLVGSEYSVL